METVSLGADAVAPASAPSDGLPTGYRRKEEITAVARLMQLARKRSLSGLRNQFCFLVMRVTSFRQRKSNVYWLAVPW